MKKGNETKPNKASSNAFLAFWSSLPGILTGVAALITAIVGLYLALGSQHKVIDPVISPTPVATPKADVSSGNCFEGEFAKIHPIEVGSGEQGLALNEGVIRIKLTDDRVVVGALRLKFYPVGDYFELEKVVDSNCRPVEDLHNLSKGSPVDVNNKPRNYDTLQLMLDGQKYSLRLSCSGGTCSANFKKL